MISLVLAFIGCDLHQKPARLAMILSSGSRDADALRTDLRIGGFRPQADSVVVTTATGEHPIGTERN